MAPNSKRRGQRGLVPCECRRCGGLIHVSQQTRRSHLSKEKTALVQLLAKKPSAPSSSVSGPHVPVHSNSPLQPSRSFNLTTNSTIIPASSSSTSQMGDDLQETADNVQSTTGTPLPDFFDAELLQEDVRDATEQEGETADAPLMDDDWEDAPSGDEGASQPMSLSTLMPTVLKDIPPSGVTVPERPPIQLSVPQAVGVPASKIHENNPDPFNHDFRGAGPPQPPANPDNVHPETAIRLLYMLVTWLHLQFHLPFRACSALIGVVCLIIGSFGRTVMPPPLTTLPRIMSKLNVEPTFDILPVCPSCLEVFPAHVPSLSTCTVCHAFLFKANPIGSSDKRTPLLRYPSMSIESQLRSILTVPGMEAEMDNWRSGHRLPGRKHDIFDGEVTKNLPDPQGEKFFRNNSGDDRGPDGELRIGLTLGVDWFSYLRSQIAPSHSSCPISFNVANLPPHLRYRTSNLLLTGIMPGPKEQDPDQCQRFLRIFVTELLRLWRDGVIIPTESCPLGRLIRIILICICCDKPAAHKMGGFGSHSHTFFCTKCWIKQSDKETAAAYKKDAFPPRTDRQQREYGEQYVKCKTNAERDEFVKNYATRWTEFARLPYFDLVRMVVIDPMHNLILGLVKTHFYHIWVQEKILRKTKELRAFHDFLKQFQMPAYLGRLPTLMGVPAGGSLTADQWLLMATVVAPIAVPQIWEDFMLNPDEARKQREQAIVARLNKKKKAAEVRKQRAALKKAGQDMSAEQAGATIQPSKRKRASNNNEEDEDDNDDVASCLHPDDPANFLKLSRALRILISREITDHQIDTAEQLLREYCTELIELYGSDVMKPNHHYAMHIADFVRDFGPLHGFWTFLFERLNKVLKSYKTNNHNGGELETTFFREFHRTILTSRLVAKSASTEGDAFQSAVALMFSASADDRGTVQALSQDLEKAREDDGVIYALSPQFGRDTLARDLYHRILLYARPIFPDLQLRSHIDPNPAPGSNPLSSVAWFYDYAIIKQHRYYAANRTKDNRSSLVEVIISQDGNTWNGELLDIVHIDQGQFNLTLGHFRWFRPLRADVSRTIWNSFIDTGVKLWHVDVYLSQNEPGPSFLLPVHFIKSHIARHEVTINNVRAWATISIAKH